MRNTIPRYIVTSRNTIPGYKSIIDEKSACVHLSKIKKNHLWLDCFHRLVA